MATKVKPTMAQKIAQSEQLAAQMAAQAAEKDAASIELKADVGGEMPEYSGIGPLGNKDYVAFGSPQHAALLGFRPDTDELMFDTSSATPAQQERFIKQRLAYRDGGRPTIGSKVPPMWDPDTNPNVTAEGVGS